ncbi:MAG: spore coat protein [Oscillospiraceae bacterium]|nr:spore coat protein [Oscillospiraceae bacterium]
MNGYAGDQKDREIMETALDEERAAAEAYSRCAIECTGAEVRAQMLDLLSEEHWLQHELLDEMGKRGWRSSAPAGEEEIERVRRRFSEQG